MKTLQYAKMGASLSTSCHCNRHLLTMARISSNRSINGPLIERDNTLHQSQVTFDNFVLLHLLYQRSLGPCIFGHDEQPRCISVQAMDNTRTQTLNPLQIRIVSE